jgi:hypothetical protein
MRASRYILFTPGSTLHGFVIPQAQQGAFDQSSMIQIEQATVTKL